MELIILSGIQCSGKSTLYLNKFSRSHAQVNLDTLKSRSKEMQLYSALLEESKPIVIDNTNSTKQDRAKYIGMARKNGYRVIGIQIDIPLNIAAARNTARKTQKPIPIGVIHNTFKKMQALELQEGFDEVYLVRFKPDAQAEVTHVVR